ncbi:MAG TPA: hypothetical protein VMB21_06070 [Candidatus Limnocylindria bacterium]|jgi:hypothetical protein|nr:hypothetical protein [Candidatus Limnocylindria bacterium]
MKSDRDRLPVKPATPSAYRPESDQGMARGERWQFGLLFAAVLFALGQQLAGAGHFVHHLPEFTNTVRLWLSNLS